MVGTGLECTSQTLEVTFKVTASPWLEVSTTSRNCIHLDSLFHCVLFLPHFLALEVSFLPLRGLQKQRFQMRSPEPSLFSGFCEIYHDCLLSTERDL